jgi:tetrathionate reductase subunit B
MHRLEEGVVPACVNTCPAEARLIGNLNDTNSEISQRISSAGSAAATLLTSIGTEPQAYYIGLNDDAYTRGTEPRTEAGKQSEVPAL